jgi:type VI secretion system protein VasG
MAEIKRTKIFGKLNSIAYKSIESATVFCKMRGNPYVEMVHWINQIFQNEQTDLYTIGKFFDINYSVLSKNLTDALDSLPRGATSISDFSNHIELTVKEGWIISSMMFDKPAIRTGHLLIAIKLNKNLNNVLRGISNEFQKVNAEKLTDDFYKIVKKSAENNLQASDNTNLTGGVAPGQASDAMAPAQMGKQEALKQFTVDLTDEARQGKMDPIVGRDREIRKITDILMRRRQNNPILTGDAGVGKTAVVEGFAQRIANGDVPPALKNVAIKSLDIGLLQAGASMKGEFENRLKQVIEEVQTSEIPIILFIDEAHTLIGAGGAAGQSDAANLLKPALARGTLRTIAATTWSEYKKYFEKDPALTRRFQNILIDEPDDENAVKMMRAISGMMEKHHNIPILDEALKASVVLSRRYLAARQLPDKSVSTLDTACARVAISQNSEPAELEYCRRKIDALNIEAKILTKEENNGIDHKKRQSELSSELKKCNEQKKKIEARLHKEKELIQKILAAKADIENNLQNSNKQDSESKAARANARKKGNANLKNLKALLKQLEQLQGDNPLVLPEVNENSIAQIIGEWTGIPVGKMVKDEVNTILNLETILKKRVIGQDKALKAVTKRIQTARAALSDPNKPIAVLMLAGPSGVGKTETALALAETLYGGEHNLITINMSEFQEAHTISTLKGAPPGYVGYGEGGVLTEAVRRKPYSVVLLDEVEKAHPDVHEIFFQVFDKGQMEDGEGRLINFRNTIILLTTNIGSDEIMGMCQDPDLVPDVDVISNAIREPLRKTFPASLLGRLVTIPYYPLANSVMESIIKLKIAKIQRRVKENYNGSIDYTAEVVQLILQRCNEIESGARMIDNIITNTMLPKISREFLKLKLENKTFKAAAIDVKNDDFIYTFK